MKDICLNGLNDLGRSYGALCYRWAFFSTNRLLLWSKFNKQKMAENEVKQCLGP
ncbi:MAG: hypothetical protein AB1414_05085 [bacterium]